MDACPYCGEVIEDARARTCPRCDADLGGAGGSDDGGEVALEELDDDELEADGFDAVAAKTKAKAKAKVARGGAGDEGDDARPAKGPPEPCPHCGKPVKKNQHRCAACGRSVRMLVEDEVWDEHARFQQNIRKGVAAGIAGLLLLTAVVVWLSRPGDAPAKRSVIRITMKELTALYGPESKVASEKQLAMWEKSHEGKFVAVAGKVRDLDEGGFFSEGALLLDAEAGERTVPVRVVLSPKEAAKASEGIRVRVEARLKSFGDDPLFTLDHGVVIEPKAK